MLQSTKQRRLKWPEALLQETCRASSPDHGRVGVEDMHEGEAVSTQYSNHMGKTFNHREPVLRPLQLVNHKGRNNTRQLGTINAVAAKVGDIGHMIAHRLSRTVFVVAVVEDTQEEEQ